MIFPMFLKMHQKIRWNDGGTEEWRDGENSDQVSIAKC